MKRFFVLVAFFVFCAIETAAQSTTALTIQEADGSPRKTISRLIVPNGSLTVSGTSATLTVASAPASSTDNAIARYNGTAGALQDSTVFISDTGLIQFAGVTSSEPALKRSGGILQVRAADDSGYASIQANNFTAITNLQLNNSTSQLTGGVAGSFDVGLLRAAAAAWRVTDASTGVGSLLRGRLVSAKTADYPVVVADSDTAFTNTGASGTVNFTLPTAAVGLTYTFYRDANQTLRITAGASTTIRVNTSVTAAAGNVTLDAVGSSVTLVAISTTQWIAIASVGTFTAT